MYVTVFLNNRHCDAGQQEKASKFFKRVQEAYRVLSDPRLRAVYNRHGKRRLEADMALIERTALPTELLEEYEKLKALWEERTYIQEVNPRGQFQMDVDASRFLAGRGGLALMKVYSHQCVDAKLTKSLQSTIMGAVLASRHQLFGGIQLSLLHLTEQQNWVKLSMMAASKPNLDLQIHHRLTDEMYVTNHNVVYLSPHGIQLSVNAHVTRRLDEQTMATFKYLALRYGAWLTWACLTLQLYCTVIPSCSFTFARVIPSCSFTFAIVIPTLFKFFVKTFLVYFKSLF